MAAVLDDLRDEGVSSADTAEPVAGGWRQHWPVLLIIAAFFLTNLPVIPDYNRFHFDEHFYIDGSLQMIESGDYFTPKFEDGSDRFNKPVLTYWVLVASYKLFGVSPLTTRLPFLLIGCISLWITYRLAWSLFRNRTAATLAPAILAWNPCFVIVSGYSITDGLMSMWVLITHFGFANVLVRKRRDHFYYFCAYCGWGLTLVTKGPVLAMGPLLIAVAYAIWRRRDGISLLHIPAMIAGVLVGAWWMVMMLMQHGERFVHDFEYDQVGRRFNDSHWYYNILYYPIGLLLMNAPWIIALAVGWIKYRPALRPLLDRHRLTFVYLGSYVALIVVMYLPGNLTRIRYLMPAFPVFAVLVAGIIGELSGQALLDRVWKRLVWGLAIFFSATAVAFHLAAPVLEPQVGRGAVLLTVIAVVLFGCAFLSAPKRPFAMTLATLAALAVSALYIEPVFSRVDAQRVLERVREKAPEQPEITALNTMSLPFRAEFRACSGAKIRCRMVSCSEFNKEQPAVLVFPDSERAKLKLDAYTYEQYSGNFKNLPIDKLIQARRMDKPDILESSYRKFFIAFKKNIDGVGPR